MRWDMVQGHPVDMTRHISSPRHVAALAARAAGSSCPEARFLGLVEDGTIVGTKGLLRLERSYIATRLVEAKVMPKPSLLFSFKRGSGS
jgi:hypothetical protein